MVAEGKIRVKRNRGEPLPEGWAIDADGNPAEKPEDFYGPPRGAILPLGGTLAHKGYALAVAIDILSGALGGGGTSREGALSGGNGIFLMALQISAFTPEDRFEEEVDAFVGFLKSSRRTPDTEEIFVPGEIEHRIRASREAEGIFVDDQSWEEILETANQLGVEL